VGQAVRNSVVSWGYGGHPPVCACWYAYVEADRSDIVAYGESDTRTRRADGLAITPVVWHLERQGGRNFTIGVYSGVGERWDAKSGKWAQTAKGYFAEISERIILQQGASGSTLKRYDRNSELLYATHDEAHTRALRRVRAIVQDEGKDRSSRVSPV